MKKIILFLALAFLYCSTESLAQTMSISVVEPLPVVDFAGFVIGNDISGAPTVFQVFITTSVPNESVQLFGVISWKDVGSNNEEEMARFLTSSFAARSFTNKDLGTLINVKSHRENNSVINRNIAKGKPTGQYYLKMLLFKSSSDLTLDNSTTNNIHFLTEASLSKPIELTNPTQTLNISEPTQNALFDPGNIIASWSAVQGVSYYQVRANYKRFPGQSLEDALRSGDPLINDVNVGLQTSVNLRTILSREWTPGKEIVLQIVGVIQGVGQDKIYSQPVSFFLKIPMNAAYISLISNMSTMLQSFAGTIPPEIMNQFLAGQISINGFTSANGQPLTVQQVQDILTYLMAHPNDIQNITFIQN